jgi:hypothetical protein
MRMLRAASCFQLIAAARLVPALVAGILVPGAIAQSGSQDFVIRQVRVFDGSHIIPVWVQGGNIAALGKEISRESASDEGRG